MQAGERKAWLVVGLGNPGPEYAETPHNMGFLAVDRLASVHNIRITRPEAKALVGKGTVDGFPVVVAKPQTYMNLSGPSVKGLLEKYELGPRDLVVVYDELDLPWGSLRVKPKGSSAGHNGMESVIRSVGTNEIARLRLGIYPDHKIRDGAQYVLAPFGRAQKLELDEKLDTACRAIESIIAEGVDKAMAKYNRRAQGSNQEG